MRNSAGAVVGDEVERVREPHRGERDSGRWRIATTGPVGLCLVSGPPAGRVRDVGAPPPTASDSASPASRGAECILTVVSAFVTAGAGFLLAVLWFDLMFDTQVRGHSAAADLPDETLASISAYYARVTTAARPMNRLIAAVMLATLAALVVEIASDDDTRPWVAWASLALAAAAILLAGGRTVPSAVRLGTGTGTTAERTRLARSIYRDHLLCLVAIVSVLVLQLAST